MKYTKEEIKAMYEYDRMMYGDFVDFAGFKKILKKALKNKKRYLLR